jgi:ribosomal protein S27E
MLNNYWEELKMDNIGEIHNKKISEMGIPKWMNLKCPYCGKEQPLRSIRSFGVKLNSRNIGDFFVEICCYDCKVSNTMYFRSEIKNIEDVIDLLVRKEPISKPIIEEEMYAQKYNNLIEWGIIEKQIGGKKCP